MPAPCRASGFSPKASIATRQKSWRPALEKCEKCCSGRRGTRRRSWRTGPRRARRPRSRRRSRPQPPIAADPCSRLGFARTPPPCRCSAPPRRLQPAQYGEEQQRQRDPGEQDQQHRDALVDGCLAVEVVGEVAPAWTASTRRQGAEGGDSQRGQHPEPVPGEREQAEGGDDQREQAAARVGEVEGQQRPPAAPPPRAQRSAVQRARRLIQSSRATAIPHSAPFAFQ